MSSQIILGPGPTKTIVIKAIESIDFHKTQKIFFRDRKLYAKQFKPLSPVKQQPPHDNNPENKVKSAIVNLENKNQTPVKPTAASQAKKATSTTPIAKHKQGLASGHLKK